MADDNDYEAEQGEDLVPRSRIRQLEQEAKAAKELRAELETVRRQNAFAVALGSTDHPARSYFEKGYDGELTVDDIRAAAREASIIGSPTTAPASTGLPADELAAHGRMAEASEGATGNQPIDLIEAFGPRGSKSPKEIMEMARAAGLRLSDDMQ